MFRPIAIALGLLILLPVTAAGSIFETSLGWVDDVDLVVAPGGEFLLSPEQRPDGSAARLRIVDLDAATGEPLGVAFDYTVPGFERGVDPVIVPELGFQLGATVLAPVESPDGLAAGLVVMSVQADGGVSYDAFIDLEDLGFHPDVDGAWDFYAGPAVAYFPLQSEDGGVRGVLAVDADPRANFGAPGVGSCTLLSTDGRLLGDANHQVDWLPGLAPGIDPVAFEDLFSSRLVLPVAGPAGADLLLLDFDPAVPQPPAFLGHVSVKALNANTPRPTPFPGYEQSVDLRHFELGCGVGGPNTLLVPVESANDEGDVYLLDKDGHSLWVLSIDGQAGGLEPFGFAPGVDMLPICNGGGSHPHRLVLPLQTSDGADADLWFVDLQNGFRYASVEAQNAGLAIEGYEIGIEPQSWIDDRVLVAVESPAGQGRLLAFDGEGFLVDTGLLADGWGFTRSVDPVVARHGTQRTLYVPVSEIADPKQSDVIGYANGGFAGGASLEAVNAALDIEFGVFVRDLDPAVVENWLPGLGWISLPEAEPDGTNARLRFELVQQTAANPVLLVATEATATVDANLRMIDAVSGFQLAEFEDLRGLVSGLDMAAGRGALAPDLQPAPLQEPGFDADSDPTVVEITTTGVGDGPSSGSELDRLAGFRHANPLRAPLSFRMALSRAAALEVDIVDLTGRRVRRLLSARREAGEIGLLWDGRDERGRPASSGVYFIVARAGHHRAASKFVYLR